MEEIWKDIKGYEGLYQVSNNDILVSKDRFTISSKGIKRFFNGKKIIGEKLPNGYISVALTKNGKTKRFLKHRLVAQAFPEICGEWFEGCQVDHINGIRDDNRPENLRICTAKENHNFELCKKNRSKSMKYSHNTLEYKEKMRGRLKNRKDLSKPVIQYTKDWQFIAEYQSTMEAQRQTGIKNDKISACCLNIKGHKSTGGYKWKYK